MVCFVNSYEPLTAKRALSQVEIEGSRGDSTLTSGASGKIASGNSRSLEGLFHTQFNGPMPCAFWVSASQPESGRESAARFFCRIRLPELAPLPVRFLPQKENLMPDFW